MEKLKTCPFCGSKAELDWFDPTCGRPGDCHTNRVRCTKCNTSFCNDDKDVLVEMWNTRPKCGLCTQFQKYSNTPKDDRFGFCTHLAAETWEDFGCIDCESLLGD